MEIILNKEQSYEIYKVSYLLLLSFFYAIYNSQYYVSIAPGCVFITSILYWNYPTNSWRRYLDIVVVNCASAYQAKLAYNSQYASYFYINFIIGALLYPIGYYYYNKGQYWMSTYAHITLHMCANIGTFILSCDSNRLQ